MAKDIVYIANVTIEGVTPLLMHKMSISGLSNKSRRTAETDYSIEWKQAAYLNEQGHLVCPSSNIEAMLMNTCKSRKIGKHAESKFMSQITVQEFEPAIHMNGNPITLDIIEENKWIDVRSVVIKRNRVARNRICIPAGWKLQFNLVVKTPMMPPDEIRDLIETAGELVGLMDYRPEKKGKFGQFELIKFVKN